MVFPWSRPRLRRFSCSAIVLALAAAAWASTVRATPEAASRYYEDAQRRYDKGDLEGASIQLKNAIQEDDSALAAHLLLGKVLVRSGDLKGAEAAFEKALAGGVSRNEVAVPLGEVYLMQGKSRAVLDRLTANGLRSAVQAQVLSLRGMAHAMLGDMTAASRSFEQARDADPTSSAPLDAEAPLLLRTGDAERAKSTAARATELAPKDPASWNTLGMVLFARNDRAGALAAYDKALALGPEHVEARIGRASVLVALGRDKDAAADLAQLQQRAVVDPRAIYLSAVVASHSGDAAAARAGFREAADLLDRTSPEWLSLQDSLLMTGALAHRALGEATEAREYLKKLVASNPRSHAGRMLLASLYVRAKDYARAAPLLDGLDSANAQDPQLLYLQGAIQMGRKRFAQAKELFERAAALNPNSEVLRDLGLAQLALGQDKQGEANLERAFALDPGDLEAGVQLAMVEARQGRRAKAVQIAETIVKRDPDNLAMINFLGNARGAAGDKRGARVAFEQVLARDAGYRPAAINLSWLDMDEGKLDAARARLTRLLAKYKDDPDVLFQLGTLEQRANRLDDAQRAWLRADDAQRQDPRPGLALVDLYAGSKQPDKMLALAKQLVGRYPDDFNVRLALARAQQLSADSAGARKTLIDATRMAGFDADRQVLVGRLQMAAGNLDDAGYNVRKALQSRADDRGALVLAVEIAARRGDATGVDAAFKTLAAKYPDSVATVLTRGHIAMSRGQYVQALADYRGALAREPATPNALLVAQAQIASGAAPEAAAFLTDWSAKHPGDRIAARALAEVQAAAGRLDAARATFDKLVRAYPDDTALLIGYAQLLARLNDPAALAAAERALKSAPTSTEAADTLGWLLVQQGNVDGGLRYLRDARLRSPGAGVVRYHLAVALAKSGRKAEARDELAAALKGADRIPENPEVARLKADLGL